MDAIAGELQNGTPLGDDQMKGNLYASANLAWNPRAGSYHNYNNMALNGLTDSFATAIEAKYTASQDMGLKNWAGYDHDHNAILNIRVNNGNLFNDAMVRIWISDNQGPSSYFIVNQVVQRNNVSNVILNNYNTGAPAYSSFTASSGYWIYGDISDNGGPAPSMPMNITTAVDVDGVGGGTNRFTYTANGTPGGAWDLITGPFNGVLVSGDNGNPFPNDPISWNKRTTFIIDIT